MQKEWSTKDPDLKFRSLGQVWGFEERLGYKNQVQNLCMTPGDGIRHSTKLLAAIAMEIKKAKIVLIRSE
jgi:hypothetical protein